MTDPHNKHDLSITLDDNTFWGLTQLGAQIKTYPEEYIESVITAHVEHELGKQTTN
jgi:hypothetical protein